MTKAELISEIALQTGYDKKTVRAIVEKFTDGIVCYIVRNLCKKGNFNKYQKTSQGFFVKDIGAETLAYLIIQVSQTDMRNVQDSDKMCKEKLDKQALKQKK